MQKLGRYQLVRHLAAGGMAEVFLAKNIGAAGFSRTCVVKRILPHLATNQEFVTMFLNEARISAQLAHPNIVQFLDLGQDGDSYFLAMEYVDGPSVRGLIHGAHQQGKRVPAPIALKIISQALEGLGYAHNYADASGRALKLVHRDISPHNLLLSRNGAVKVADFGIAKAASIPSITKTGQIKGKVRYMSPEQLYDDPLDCRSDLFAVGLTLFEILTGKRPFHGDNEGAVMQAIATAPHDKLAGLMPEVPRGLQEILDRALVKDRAKRYPTAAAMQEDVEALLVKMGAVVRGAEIAKVIAELTTTELAPTGAEASLVTNAKLPPRASPPRPAAPPPADEPPATQIERRPSGDRHRRAEVTAPDDAPETHVERFAEVSLPHGRTATRNDAETDGVRLPPELVGGQLPAGRKVTRNDDETHGVRLPDLTTQPEAEGATPSDPALALRRGRPETEPDDRVPTQLARNPDAREAPSAGDEPRAILRERGRPAEARMTTRDAQATAPRDALERPDPLTGDELRAVARPKWLPWAVAAAGAVVALAVALLARR